MNTQTIKYKIALAALLSVFLFTGCDSPVNNSNIINDANDLSSETPSYGEMDKKNGQSKVENSYIVVLKNNSNASGNARAAERSTGGKVGFVYNNALKGYSIQLPPQASTRALEALRNNPNVEFIEEDKEVYALGTQTNATWGLDRIDQQSLPLDGLYNYENTAGNVTAYILDTGINYSHTDFSGRASFGFDAYGGDGTDCDGHGTHVAGTVGGDTWGVAKNVQLVAVRVLDCNGSGTYSGVIAGIDWVTANASGPSVANMSLGGGFSSSLNTAVKNSVEAGITYAVSAGNENTDACTKSPASTQEAITVGSTSSSDARSSFSNYGSCVDIFAPGSGITSAWIGSNSATATLSGTSMAAPHVAGVAALYLQTNTAASPADVYTALFNNSTKNIVTNSSTENNHLLYSVFGSDDGGGTDPAPNEAPVAGFTFSVTDLSADFTSTSTDSDGNIASYSWDFGDGSTSSSANPSHTYSAEGTYSVSLTVTDNDGDSDTATQSVQVTEPAPEPNNPPTADFTLSVTDLSVTFTSTSTDSDGSIASYSWDFGDGSTSASANPSYTYSAEGTYNVSLTVTDDDGDSDTITKSVQVSEPAPDPVTPPAINTVNVSTRNTGPWSRAEVNWSVSDADGDLASVKVELLSGSSVVDSVTNSVSGATASGLSELRNRGSVSAVRVTVTDSSGNTTTQTVNI
jgi:subtilisin family serine protease